MKNSILTCLFSFFLVSFSVTISMTAAQADTAIPHYEVYPQTPFEDYNEAILDFYSVKNLYGEFSNFALFPIVIDGVVWPTSEHYYQAHKYIEPELRELVRAAATPHAAAQIGRDPKIPKREDWNQVKDPVMETAVRAKFSQYPILQKLLLQTKDSQIFEHTKLDCYWGDCGDRSGQNKLGLLLMKLRSELKP